MSFETEKQGSNKKMPMLSSMKGNKMSNDKNRENAKKKKRAQWNKPNGII